MRDNGADTGRGQQSDAPCIDTRARLQHHVAGLELGSGQTDEVACADCLHDIDCVSDRFGTGDRNHRIRPLW